MAEGFTFQDAPPEPEGPAPLKAITAEEFLATTFPPREAVLAPWLPAKGLAMIYGLVVSGRPISASDSVTRLRLAAIS
jgi:hypothetical protein